MEAASTNWNPMRSSVVEMVTTSTEIVVDSENQRNSNVPLEEVAIVLVILYEVMQVNQINEQISARLSEQDWNGTIDQTEHPLGAMIFNYMPSKLSLTFQALCSLLGMCVSLYLKLKH
eukprot:gene35000-45304_t